jgi:hypothetical protein
MKPTNVINLIDHAPVACADKPDMIQWLRVWTDGLAEGRYGDFRSVVLIVESTDGQLATLSQSLGEMDQARLVGLLHTAAHLRLDGRAQMADLSIEG